MTRRLLAVMLLCLGVLGFMVSGAALLDYLSPAGLHVVSVTTPDPGIHKVNVFDIPGFVVVGDNQVDAYFAVPVINGRLGCAVSVDYERTPVTPHDAVFFEPCFCIYFDSRGNPVSPKGVSAQLPAMCFTSEDGRIIFSGLNKHYLDLYTGWDCRDRGQ